MEKNLGTHVSFLLLSKLLGNGLLRISFFISLGGKVTAFIRRLFVAGVAACVVSVVPVADAQQTSTSISVDNSGMLPVQVDGPFGQWGIPTPPGAEGYSVNGMPEDAELQPEGLSFWEPTSEPAVEVIPGEMRSDYEGLPVEVAKADADRAETMEARLQGKAIDGAVQLAVKPGCQVYWPLPHEVCGAIRTKYNSIGGPTSFLLFPVSDELTNPDGVGKRTHFNNGHIYWHPDTGAHTVSLPADVVWKRHGREQGFLGYPLTSDMAQGDDWFRQDFQGGHVYTHNALPPVQASIQGAIFEKWQQMGAQNSDLGFPLSDELTTPDGIGRYNVFEGGMIYWTPQHGAHAVSGLTLFLWGAGGFERGNYGYPVGDALVNSEGEMVQTFTKGALNLTRLLREAEDVSIDGQPVNSVLATALATQGNILTSGPGVQAFGSPELRAGILAANNGGVPVPEGYEYLPSKGSLNDYCTKSPDEFRPIGVEAADFRGPCAIHDMCYYRLKGGPKISPGYAACNREMWSNLNTVCNNVYADQYVTRVSCRRTAKFYYEVVVAVHPYQWPGHVPT